MTVKDRDVLKLLFKNGWTEERIHGSHHILVKDGKTISLPVHGKDMKPGILHDIYKRANLK
jgi:predicted RNA binding protein YcfA (HicA-like mRNA interferase family)